MQGEALDWQGSHLDPIVCCKCNRMKVWLYQYLGFSSRVSWLFAQDGPGSRRTQQCKSWLHGAHTCTWGAIFESSPSAEASKSNRPCAWFVWSWPQDLLLQSTGASQLSIASAGQQARIGRTWPKSSRSLHYSHARIPQKRSPVNDDDQSQIGWSCEKFRRWRDTIWTFIRTAVISNLRLDRLPHRIDMGIEQGTPHRTCRRWERQSDRNSRCIVGMAQKSCIQRLRCYCWSLSCIFGFLELSALQSFWVSLLCGAIWNKTLLLPLLYKWQCLRLYYILSHEYLTHFLANSTSQSPFYMSCWRAHHLTIAKGAGVVVMHEFENGPVCKVWSHFWILNGDRLRRGGGFDSGSCLATTLS